MAKDTISIESTTWVGFGAEGKRYFVQNQSDGIIYITTGASMPTSRVGAFELNPGEVMSDVFLPGKPWVISAGGLRDVNYWVED
jgi:hypothetical protein